MSSFKRYVLKGILWGSGQNATLVEISVQKSEIRHTHKKTEVKRRTNAISTSSGTHTVTDNDNNNNKTK